MKNGGGSAGVFREIKPNSDVLYSQGSKRKSVRSLLHVSGDGLKVVDDDTKGLIVDQTIEKVSFCAPDRNYERGFSYICRDGTTRRWMCHGFIAIKESVSQLNFFAMRGVWGTYYTMKIISYSFKL